MNRREFFKVGTALSLAAGTAVSGAETLPEAFEMDPERQKAAEKKIAAAREVALSILKPTAKQLEHGLELHANSLVIESYGFSPRAAVDGEALARAYEAGASGVELADLREEMSMTRYIHDIGERTEYMTAWKASGVTCILQNAGEEGNAIDRLIKRLARYTYVTDRLRGFVSKAVTPDDIVRAGEQNRHCLCFSGNGVPLPQRWVSVEDELRYIRVFHQLGWRMAHLTYNRRNPIGEGCGESADAGLSDFGKAVVKEMNRVGMLVDVAHTGWQSCIDAAKASDKPVVASHSGCWALNKHYRCKTDAVLRALADTDGYMGICCIPQFLGGKGDIGVMMDHIDYVAKKFGVERLAIGTDVAYASTASAAENRKAPKQRTQRDEWEHLWPDPDPSSKPEGPVNRAQLSISWTNWPLFTVALVQRGYSDDDIRKIIGGNVLRVVRAVFRG
ncbi:MAG: membrane dipeptidase [Sedimentisphaerales bacterium]|nr:membrane dipeptidase [Sedimentisphaerales bacterium]